MSSILFRRIVFIAAATVLSASTFAQAVEQPISFLGNPAPSQATVDQVIVLDGATRNLSVAGGSTVRFIAGDRSFVWTFQNGSAHLVPFDLARIAPAGFFDRKVTVYVSDNLLYSGA
jgi:hypothetical protein